MEVGITLLFLGSLATVLFFIGYGARPTEQTPTPKKAAPTPSTDVLSTPEASQLHPS